MVASWAHLIEGLLRLPCTDGTWAPPGCLLITFPVVWYVAVAAFGSSGYLPFWCGYPPPNFLVIRVSWRCSNRATVAKVDQLSVVFCCDLLRNILHTPHTQFWWVSVNATFVCLEENSRGHLLYFLIASLFLCLGGNLKESFCGSHTGCSNSSLWHACCGTIKADSHLKEYTKVKEWIIHVE